MNGNSRLYRSTSDAMLGGVAAGLANYLKIDPTMIRIALVVLTFFSSGAFLVVYLALWLLIPTAGSTAVGPNQIVQENLNEMGAKVRSFTGGVNRPSNPGSTGSGGASGAGSNGGSVPAGSEDASTYAVAQLPQPGASAQARQSLNPAILIALGVFFLLANFGFFHGIHWGAWWPLILIGLGAIMLARRSRP